MLFIHSLLLIVLSLCNVHLYGNEEKENFILSEIEKINLPTVKMTYDINDWLAYTTKAYVATLKGFCSDLSPYYRRIFAFKVFKQALQEIKGGKPPRELWDNLTLFAGSNTRPESYLAEKLNRAHSQLGFIALMHILGEQTQDISLLNQRQLAIAKIRTDKNIAQSLEKHFKTLADNQDQFLFFWDGGASMGVVIHEIRKVARLPIPFVSKDFRGGEKFRSVMSANALRSFFNETSETIISCAASACLFATLLARLTTKDTSALPETVTSMATNYKITGLPMAITPLVNIKNITLENIVIFIAGISLLNKAQKSFEELKDSLLISDLINYFALNASRALHTIKNVYSLIKDTPELINLPEVQPLHTFFTQTAVSQPDIKEMVEKLLAYDPTSESTWFHDLGHAARSLLLFFNNRSIVAQALAAIGHVEAYAGLATLMNEHQTKSVKFCFPSYVTNSQKPLLKSTNFWHPMIAPEKAQVNSIALGCDAQQQNGILSGENTGGKSTILKAIMLNALMGQTIGIAAADECLFTPFANLQTYMNVSDDIGAGQSLFMSQVKRIKDMAEITEKNHQENIFTFGVYDEVANGTNFNAASALVYHTAAYLAQFDTSINIFASHFPRSQFLETGTGRFNTYVVSAKPPLFKLLQTKPLAINPCVTAIPLYERSTIEKVFSVLERVDYPAAIQQAIRQDIVYESEESLLRGMGIRSAIAVN